jgi:hypothetical protein
MSQVKALMQFLTAPTQENAFQPNPEKISNFNKGVPLVRRLIEGLIEYKVAVKGFSTSAMKALLSALKAITGEGEKKKINSSQIPSNSSSSNTEGLVAGENAIVVPNDSGNGYKLVSYNDVNKGYDMFDNAGFDGRGVKMTPEQEYLLHGGNPITSESQASSNANFMRNPKSNYRGGRP